MKIHTMFIKGKYYNLPYRESHTINGVKMTSSHRKSFYIIEPYPDYLILYQQGEYYTEEGTELKWEEDVEPIIRKYRVGE